MWLKCAGMAGVVLASGLISAAAQAIPAVSQAPAAWASSVSAAASRPCRWQQGQRSCSTPRGGTTGYGFTGSDYYEHDANKLPFGTERWRDQMRRENRLGNPG